MAWQGDPLTDPLARDHAARDFRRWQQVERRAAASTVNLALASLDALYRCLGLGRPYVRRDKPALAAPRALDEAAQRRRGPRTGSRRGRDGPGVRVSARCAEPCHLGLRPVQPVRHEDRIRRRTRSDPHARSDLPQLPIVEHTTDTHGATEIVFDALRPTRPAVHPTSQRCRRPAPVSPRRAYRHARLRGAARPCTTPADPRAIRRPAPHGRVAEAAAGSRRACSSLG